MVELKRNESSSYTCKLSLVHQQVFCWVIIWGVVEVNQGAVEYQVELQAFTVRHNLKDLVLWDTDRGKVRTDDKYIPILFTGSWII